MQIQKPKTANSHNVCVMCMNNSESVTSVFTMSDCQFFVESAAGLSTHSESFVLEVKKKSRFCETVQCLQLCVVQMFAIMWCIWIERIDQKFSKCFSAFGFVVRHNKVLRFSLALRYWVFYYRFTQGLGCLAHYYSLA